MTGPVLVLDGRALSSLAVARQLDSTGTTVHVAESFRWNLTAYSAATARSHRYPSPDDRPAAFKQAVRDLIERIDASFVIPARDATTRCLADLAGELPAGTTLLDSPDRIEQLQDKRRCAALAEDLGIPVPATYDPQSRDIESIGEAASFPVLIKPTNASGARGIRRVEEPAQLPQAYAAATRDGEPVIVQEFVDHSGGHFSIGAVFGRDGTARAIHVYEELRQYPDSGGPAILARSIEPEPWVYELLGLLESIDWTGPAHMDVLFDPADRTYKLLEVNPRLWSSLGLTIAAGVDVPNTMLAAASADDPGPPASYETDLTYRWVVPNELLWLLDGPDVADRLRALLGTERDSTVYSILSKSDPGAVLGTALQSIRFLSDGEKRAQVLGRDTDQLQSATTLEHERQ